MVLRAQKFINSFNVEGVPRVEENGQTSWAVMHALTRLLQYKLGVSPLSDSFGPATLAALQLRHPVIKQGSVADDINRIIQSGLYCKGYDGSDIDGEYGDRVAAAVWSLRSNMGLTSPSGYGAVTPKVFKAILNMDAYVVVNDGSEQIRSVQRWMNARYISRRDYFIIPCDGHFSRDVQKGLMRAIQYELGMTDDEANGVFGPNTQAGLRQHELAQGATGVWVQLYSAAMLFNKRPLAVFTSTFDSNLYYRTRVFQQFVRLPITGVGTYPTWASLLISYGDNTRKGTACDCITQITSARASALKAEGYKTIGRYLCNAPGPTSLNKMIQPGELQVIAGEGLSVFPIFQTIGRDVSNFSWRKGQAEGLTAVEWAQFHGFKAGTRIYFAVDFDVTDDQIENYVVPHFDGIGTALENSGYVLGIYGPRNACSKVARWGWTSASFVADLSSGFSGNLGYPLPEDWAFDQISTVTVGSGTGMIEIDNNIASGRDAGQNSFNPGSPSRGRLDVAFDPTFRDAMLTDVRQAFIQVNFPEEGPEVYRIRSTEEAFDLLLSVDQVVTERARQLRVRKSLIQASLLWELRMWDWDDQASDALVIMRHNGETSPIDDCSTGYGQIFARTAIAARNSAITRGILSGDLLDGSNLNHVWSVWQQLHNEPSYNAATVGYVHLHSAWEKVRPGFNIPLDLDADYDLIFNVLKAYNGSGDQAEKVAEGAIGLYYALEKYNQLIRNRA
jgi:peptidoglycan hydrolase-like protein with peptidoglycan-binding domain